MRLPLAHPSMQRYLPYMEKPAAAPVGAVTARFLGTSSLLLQDGTTTVLSDGFVTRPSIARTVAGTIQPDRDVITRAINRLDITTMSAVFCCHSHYDHALDAPIWAAQTGAQLLGSQSTANVGRGLGLQEQCPTGRRRRRHHDLRRLPADLPGIRPHPGRPLPRHDRRAAR
ncbi:MBL fold metallo-hydrolase [Streptomyces sp. NPDC002730]|uniref:MBL fold metallo-hydrolase n=1 Tax=Streptomyces sp. NPDC002730 TaxID=3364662 RepID=UPI0036BD468D